MHGGKSTGRPQTNGMFTKPALKRKAQIRELRQQLKEFKKQLTEFE